MLKRILVPLDGSKQSYKTLDFALELAKDTGSKIWIMHVVDKKVSDELEETLKDAISGVHLKDVIDAYAELAGKEIFIKAEKKAKEKGIGFETYSVTGKPAEEIIEYAHKMKSDLIIIGKTGIGKAEQFLFGSVTDKVARHAPCTVTIVR